MNHKFAILIIPVIAFFLLAVGCTTRHLIQEAYPTLVECYAKCDEMRMELDTDYRTCIDQAISNLTIALNKCPDGKFEPWEACSQNAFDIYNESLTQCAQNWIIKIKECREVCFLQFSNSIESEL